MNAATVTDRVKAMRLRNLAKGLKELRGLWAAPEDHQAIKDYAAKLSRKRAKSVSSQLR